MYVLRRGWLKLPCLSLIGMLLVSGGAIAQNPASIQVLSQAERPWIDVPPPLEVPEVPPPSRETEATIRYLVYVNSRSSERLQQIRRLNPEAGFGLFQGEQIIQAGLFRQRGAAERRSRQLAEQGISSQIAAVTVPDQSPFNGSNARNGSYYVVIPGSEGTLDEAMATVQANVNPGTRIQRRDRPRGLHLAIGPFRDREMAQRLSDRLRGRGLSQTRVHYDPE
ncbi:MAG: Cell division protein [Phormidium sp. OSCR]|nr:MAG: Cell division protein [Phormidium sp. OSCR]